MIAFQVIQTLSALKFLKVFVSVLKILRIALYKIAVENLCKKRPVAESHAVPCFRDIHKIFNRLQQV